MVSSVYSMIYWYFIVQNSTRRLHRKDLSVSDVRTDILNTILYFVSSESQSTLSCNHNYFSYTPRNKYDTQYLCVWCFTIGDHAKYKFRKLGNADKGSIASDTSLAFFKMYKDRSGIICKIVIFDESYYVVTYALLSMQISLSFSI